MFRLRRLTRFWINICNIYIKKTYLVKNIRKSFKKWSLNLWLISNKTIMEVGNITETSTFKSFLQLSYKNTQLLFFVTVLFYFSHEINLNRWFLGITKKYIYFFILSGFSFTNIHKSQDCRGRGRAFLYLLTTTSTASQVLRY